MPDLATIATFLGSIKTATEIAKAIKLSDSSIEKAELKLKIAELMESLADVKIQAIEIKELLQEKDLEIEKLKNLLNTKFISKIDELPEQCVEILKSFNKTSEEVEIWMIAEFLHISEQKTQYFLKKLIDLKLIDEFIYTGKSTYLISDNGREYLFKNNMLE